MISNKKRIRVDYAPLNLAVSVECVTPASPALQVYNADLDESGEAVGFEPDRELSPSKFWPVVVANAADGSWANQYANTVLTDMRWYVDGVLISRHPDFTGSTSDGRPLYAIDEGGTSYRGSIEIRKNVLPGTRYALHFEGVVTDPRLGTNLTVVTDDFILSTEDKSEDAYSISIGDDQIIQYNPFKDRLHLYNYKVAHGLAAASPSAEAAATDENAYLRKVDVALYKAGKRMTSGYTLRLYRVNGANQFTELTDGTDEVVSVTATAVTLDLRLVEKSDYIVKAFVTDSARTEPMIQFSVNRVYQNYSCRPTNGTGINPGDIQRHDEAMVDSEGEVVECPASIIRILWRTDSAYLTNLLHNEGGTTTFTIAKTMMGENYDDDWLDVYTETEIKPVFRSAVDGDGNQLVDENGNRLIFN